MLFVYLSILTRSDNKNVLKVFIFDLVAFEDANEKKQIYAEIVDISFN